MPPRMATVHTAGTGFGSWYGDLPPITRAFGTLCFAATAAFFMGFLNPMLIALFWPQVLKKFEVWRLLTNFFFLGKFSFNFVIKLMWIHSYGVPLEQQTYRFQPADYGFMLFFSSVTLVLSSLVLYLLPFGNAYSQVLNGEPLIFVLVYVWSRNFADQQVSIMGLITIQAFHLPFAFMGVNLVMGNSIVPGVFGIVVGHLWHFLKDLYPLQSGVDVLRTPNWFKDALFEMGIGAPSVAPVAGESQPGFRAFGGGARRLGTD